MPRAKTIEVANRADVANVDIDSIIARRLSGEPFGTRNVEIPLKEPGKWALFEANSLADSNMHYRMVHQLGWTPLYADDLAPGITPESIGWSVGDSGMLCKGNKGDQRLYKQPVEVRNQIQAAKARANMKGIGSAKAVKESVAEATSAAHGDEAASFVHSNISITGSDRIGPLGS